MYIFDDIKKYKAMLADERNLVKRQRERIVELTAQLADCRIHCRVKDRIIMEKEGMIDALKAELRNREIVG